MAEYLYEQVSGGYRWNMMRRIYGAICIEPTASGDVGGQTVLTFDRDLTDDEKAQLDTLMADNPTLPPASPTVLKIKDILNHLEAFNAATGVAFQLYYNESVSNSGDIDLIELHSLITLTLEQQEKAKAEYSKLISTN